MGNFYLYNTSHTLKSQYNECQYNIIFSVKEILFILSRRKIHGVHLKVKIMLSARFSETVIILLL